MNHFSKKDLLGAIDKCCLREQELYYFRQGNLPSSQATATIHSFHHHAI